MQLALHAAGIAMRQTPSAGPRSNDARDRVPGNFA
jgi:hypothetical protein